MSLKEKNITIRIPYIIVAEDDVDDKLLIQDAFEANDIKGENIFFVENGDELITRLNGPSRHPVLIMLDLNMPKKDGRETLREIKNDDLLKHIPVIIFTTSSSEDDIRLTYKHGGNTFFTKPALFNDLVDVIGIIKKYWLEKAALA